MARRKKKLKIIYTYFFFFSFTCCLLNAHLRSSSVVHVRSSCSQLTKSFALFALSLYTLLSLFLFQEKIFIVRKWWMLELGLI
jgi:hypothetical protein